MAATRPASLARRALPALAIAGLSGGVRVKLDDPAPAVLRRAVPDLAERVAVLCGPERLLLAARAGMRDAGIPDDRIHCERVWW